MRKRFLGFLSALYSRLLPKPDHKDVLKYLSGELADARQAQSQQRSDHMERVQELVEARQMAGAGPWQVGPQTLAYADRVIEAADARSRGISLKETASDLLVGGGGEIDLMLDTIEWRRETAFSWLQFSRHGIQMIMLICRLYYIKHPWIRRGIEVAAAYVWGRGFEVSSSDETANQVLEDFFEDNRETLGQIALAETHKRKFYDGNLFWVLFADAVDTGEVQIRTIDATEVMEIICDPDDSDKPWFYKRVWAQVSFDLVTGVSRTETLQAWYPALNYTPDSKPASIGGLPVKWDSPVHHRRCGAISKWKFGCPLVFSALDWARTGKDFLAACMTVRKSLAQIAIKISSKGGQQALAGIKNQLGTNVGPTSPLWDTNPTAVAGSVFASGPGTTMEAFNTRGAGGDTADVKEYRNMVACVLGIPPTFLADMETSNLATATTLDRPTELNFLSQQEEWREDLLIICKYVLSVSQGAPSGRLLASDRGQRVIREAHRVKSPDGKRMVYEAFSTSKDDIAIKVSFPSLLEGDVPVLIKAWAEAMTLDNKGGQVVGIDEKTGVRGLCEILGIEDADELVETMYPDAEYDPDRTKEIEPAPIPTTPPIASGGRPQAAPGAPAPRQQESHVTRASKLLERALAKLEN